MKNLYLIEAKTGGDPLAYKIGISNNPVSRKNNMQTSNFAALFLVHTFKCANAEKIEKYLHEQWESYRFSNAGKEWFKPVSNIKIGVSRLATLYNCITEETQDFIANSNLTLIKDYIDGKIEIEGVKRKLNKWIRNKKSIFV